MYYNIKKEANQAKKPMRFHRKLHSLVTSELAAALVEQATRTTLKEMKSESIRWEINRARTLYFGCAIGLGSTGATAAELINKTPAIAYSHVRKFEKLIQSDSRFKAQYKIIIKNNQKIMSDTINQNGKTYVSADILNKVVQETINSMGITQMMEEIKKIKNPQSESTDPEGPEVEPWVQAHIDSMDPGKDPLAGKQI